MAVTYQGIWRDPPEESDDLYPGLSVNDGRVSGSILVHGPSRLPLWAFVWPATVHGWKEAEEYGPSQYGWTAEKMGAFLYDLLELRGEFGRLLLVLANEERQERESEDDLPAGWWHDPARKMVVAAQLRRCLEALGE